MNRIGDNDGAQMGGDAADTARVVVAILQSKADVTSFQINSEGDVRFILPFRWTKLTKADLLKMQMATSTNLSGFLGEWLILRNPRRFEPLVLREDYRSLVGKYRHQHFGMWIESTGVRFQFHLSLLNELFNRELKGMLTREIVEDD